MTNGGKWGLRVTFSPGSPQATVSVAGRVSGANAGRLEEALEGARAGGERRVAVDLAAVDYVSSVGVQVLGRMTARFAEDGGELLLVNVQAPVSIALDLAGIPFKV